MVNDDHRVNENIWGRRRFLDDQRIWALVDVNENCPTSFGRCVLIFFVWQHGCFYTFRITKAFVCLHWKYILYIYIYILHTVYTYTPMHLCTTCTCKNMASCCSFQLAARFRNERWRQIMKPISSGINGKRWRGLTLEKRNRQPKTKPKKNGIIYLSRCWFLKYCLCLHLFR